MLVCYNVEVDWCATVAYPFFATSFRCVGTPGAHQTQSSAFFGHLCLPLTLINVWSYSVACKHTDLKISTRPSHIIHFRSVDCGNSAYKVKCGYFRSSCRFESFAHDEALSVISPEDIGGSSGCTGLFFKDGEHWFFAWRSCCCCCVLRFASSPGCFLCRGWVGHGGVFGSFSSFGEQGVS